MSYFFRYFVLLLCVSAFLTSGCRNTNSPNLEYEIVKSSLDSLPALEVRMAFVPEEGIETLVEYPNEAWGEKDLFGHIREIRLLEGKGRVDIEPDSGRIRINHPEGTRRLVLSYKIVQYDQEEDDSYRPLVKPNYFHVFGHNLFAVPSSFQEGADPEVQINLTWTGWEPGEVIHNSFGSRARIQDLGALSPDTFHQAIFVGGDYRVYSESLEDNMIHLAIRGDWIPFEEEDVMFLLVQTISAQRDFWRDQTQPYFTVTMRPYPQEKGSSFQGTGLTNSFASSVSNNTHTEMSQLVYLFNHELMHNWIGYNIKNEDEEAQYWFSEGFTDYYTSKNISTYGIHEENWDYFIDNINETIRLLEASPVKDAPNSEITYENFWNDRAYEKLPYRRGSLFAFLLDLKIRKDTNHEKSLDDAMRDFLKASRDRDAKVSDAHFLETINSYLAQDFTPSFKKYILNGEALPLKEVLDEWGIDYLEEAKLFDLGFSYGTQIEEALEVDADSEAYKAGLRSGDKIKSRSIYFGDIEMPVELTLVRDGKTFPISYFPVRKEAVVQIVNSSENQAKFKG